MGSRISALEREVLSIEDMLRHIMVLLDSSRKEPTNPRLRPGAQNRPSANVLAKADQMRGGGMVEPD